MMTNTGTDLVPTMTTAVVATAFAAQSLDPLLVEIEEHVRSHVPDLTTAKGRKAIASLAHKVARTKTALDDVGRDLNAGHRKEIDAVDSERRKIRDRLDKLKAEARKPLTDWEEAEEAREAVLKDRMDGLMIRTGPLATSYQIAAEIERFNEVFDGDPDEWDDLWDGAVDLHSHAITTLKGQHGAAVQREEEAVELERLRKAEAERQEQREREQRAADAKAEADAAAKRKAEEEAEQTRREARAAEKAKAEDERKAKGEAVAAAEKVKRDAAMAEKRHQQELRDAEEARKAEAAREDQRRIDAARKVEAEKKERAANKELQDKVRHHITAALEALEDHSAEGIARALMAGEIPHCQVSL